MLIQWCSVYVQEEPGHDTAEVLVSVGKQTVFGEAITADPAGKHNTALLHFNLIWLRATCLETYLYTPSAD